MPLVCLGLQIAPFLLSQLILRVGKKSQCSSSLWSWQLLISICESLLGGSSKSHISVLITVHKWNFYKCFSKVTFWGEILFWKQILDYLEFFGFTLCFRIFQAKKIKKILTTSSYLFAISVGQLYTTAAIKELHFKAEAGAVGSPRAESEL